ncbi:hypothetical protein GmHk_11G032243 [Glycine max]|nr:hypothetical protein JHK87_031183 [Glycine soja]KAH1225309.1 hypothetical protein GmHk_11G032243 [Glycine max]
MAVMILSLQVNEQNAGKVQKRKAPAKPAKPAHVKPAKPTPVSVKIAKAAPVKTAKPVPKPAPIKNAKLAGCFVCSTIGSAQLKNTAATPAATSPVGHYTKMSYGIAKSANTGKRKDAVLHNNNDKAKKKMKLSERTTPSANAAPSSIHKLKKLCELTKGSIYA